MDYQINNVIINSNKGKVTCNRNILLSIINLAAKEIDGVSSLCDNFTGVKKYFSSRYFEGVKVAYVNEGITVDIYLNIFYGYSVPDVSYRIQENVKNGISSMMDIKVNAINVHVVNVDYSKQAQ